MRLLGETLGVDIQVFGPDTHITAVVPLALGVNKNKPNATVPQSIPASPPPPNVHPIDIDTRAETGAIQPSGERTQPNDQIVHFGATSSQGARESYRPFDANTRSFVYGLQPRAIQGMLDFDFACGRSAPSVAAMIYPFGGHHIQKFYWGTKETLLPAYTSLKEAVSKHPGVDVVVNFASSRLLKYPRVLGARADQGHRSHR